MLTVKISKLDPESVLDPHNLVWLRRRIGVPLQVLSITYTHKDPELFSVSVLKNPGPDVEVITIFIFGNNTELVLEGDLQ